ncbi:MAG: thermonuclease family protein [Ignavibacteriales bacterium]|nr:thermonuclease family protein [Ignavibacteriales bacterium]
MQSNLFHYKAIITDVYDGDTCTADIDLGFGIWIRGEKLRLHRINAPEVVGGSKTKGLESKKFLTLTIAGKEVTLETIKDKKEKYGRYLAEIWILDKSGKRVNVNDMMVEKGYAEYKKY